MHSWLHWQLIDSAFPTGAFAHASGLESAIQSGTVRDLDAVCGYVRDSLDQLACGALPVVRAVAAGEDFATVDRLWDGHLANHVAKAASRELGRTLVSSAHTAFGREALRLLKRRIRDENTPGHQAPCWGACCRHLGIAEEDACALFTFTTARDLLSAAVRLGACGPGQAQAAQWHLAGDARRACARARGHDWRWPRQSAPLIDLHQAHHEHLYSRLFRS